MSNGFRSAYDLIGLSGGTTIIPNRMKTPGRPLLAMLFCAAASAMAQEYKIQMQRPAKEGQRFELSCRLHETRRVSATAPGRYAPEQKTNFVAELDGLVEVLETNSKGRITKASCTISNCVRVEGPNKRELLPSQTVVVASAGKGHSAFLVKGRPVALESKKILAEGLQLIDDETIEEIYGTAKPKKVGERWDVNPDYFAWVLRSQDLGIRTSDIQGQTSLEQIVKVGGVDCLELASKVYLKKFVPPLPPDVQIKQAFGALRLSGKYPLDMELAALEEMLDFDVTFMAQPGSGPNAGITIKTVLELKRTLQRKYLK